MLLFAAILIWVVLRNLEAPIKFGTRSGPALVGIALVLFALPIYGDVAGVESLANQGSLFRVFAGFLLPTGLYLMRPLTSRRNMYGPPGDEREEKGDGIGHRPDAKGDGGQQPEVKGAES
jgi:hypothetical protein